jgi:ubiquinone/menaquinone biosynthesis C-methylase UbiE
MSILSELPRSSEAELLDSPAVDPAALADNLRDLRQVDRYLGGTALIWRYLLPMLRRLPGRSATLLDVATGGADGPRRLSERAQSAGYDLRPVASDRLLAALRLARASGARFPLIQHDALAIPFCDGGVDFVTCSLALHHFEPDAAVALLRELKRVARRGAIVVDLRRSWPAYWGARLLALGPWHAMARHDGPLSVLRAYTLDEVRALVVRADLVHTVVAELPLFRVAVVMSDNS